MEKGSSKKNEKGNTKKIKSLGKGNDPEYTGSFGSKGGGISKTVPNQSITIKELFLRHTRGMPIPEEIAQVKEPQYLGDLELPQFADFTDKDEWNRELQRKKENVDADLKEAEEKYKANKKAEEDAYKTEHEKKIQNEVNQRLVNALNPNGGVSNNDNNN